MATTQKRRKAEQLKVKTQKLKAIEATANSLARVLNISNNKQEEVYRFTTAQMSKFPNSDSVVTRTFLKSVPTELGRHYRQLLKEKCKRAGNVGGAFSKAKYLTPAAEKFFTTALGDAGPSVLPKSNNGLTTSSNFTAMMGAVWRAHADEKAYKVSAQEALARGITKGDGSQGTDALRRFPDWAIEILNEELKQTVQADYDKMKNPSQVATDHKNKIITALGKPGAQYMPTVAEYLAGPFNPWAFNHIKGSKLQNSMLEEPQQPLDPDQIKTNAELNTLQYNTIKAKFPKK